MRRKTSFINIICIQLLSDKNGKSAFFSVSVCTCRYLSTYPQKNDNATIVKARGQVFGFFFNLLESSENSIIERTITALVNFTDDNTSDDDVVW